MKTLVILDTNRVRSTLAGGVAYGSFEFSAEFSELKSYIEDNGLSEFIKIAIPSVSIEELLQQKVEQYSEDIQGIADIKDRLSELPGVNFSGVSLPAADFDCREHLTPRIADFVKSSGLIIIDIEEERFGRILKDVLRRAIERRPPFTIGRNFKDMGFKDVLIWESILNYGAYNNYDKVILFTGDTGFDERCKTEFESRTKKELVITPLMESLQAEIDDDYASLIQSKEWRDFVAKDYFKSYLKGELSKLEHLPVNGVDCKVIQTTVVDHLDSIEQPEDSEQTGISIVLVSSLKGTLEIGGSPKEVNIRARTFLDDEKEIQYTEFVVE